MGRDKNKLDSFAQLKRRLFEELKPAVEAAPKPDPEEAVLTFEDREVVEYFTAGRSEAPTGRINRSVDAAQNPI